MTTDMTVKFAEGSDTIIEGYGVPFGLDLDGQQFTAKTERYHEWFPNGGRPILYHHGFNDEIGFKSVGRELSTEPRAEGDWVRGELDKADAYYEKIAALVRAGKVGWSSGAPDHKVKIAADGTIERWPVIEYSLTPTPAFPNHVAFSMKSAQWAAALADTEIPEPLRAKAEAIEQTQEPQESEAYNDHSEQVLAEMVKAWVDRTVERVDRRSQEVRLNGKPARKSGRELSKRNVETLREAHRIIGELLERNDKPTDDEAEAAKSALALRLALTES